MNLRYFFASSVALGLLAVLPAVSASAQVANGSFEDPTLPSGYEYVAGGSTSITGWTTTSNGVERFDPSIYSIGSAQDGKLVIDLNPTSFTGGGIMQTVSTTVGQNYVLTFYGGTSNAFGRTGTGEIDLAITGAAPSVIALNNANANIVWNPYSVGFTATSAATTIAFSNNQDSNTHFSFVDNVAVAPAAVPEPGTIALVVGLALPGGAFLRRRKASK